MTKLHELELNDDQITGLNAVLNGWGRQQAAMKDSDIVRRVFSVKLKGEADTESRSVRVVASSDAMDSYDEIVEQSWLLERYRANPVVLYNHNRVGLCGAPEDTLPIGHATDVELVAGKLEATLHFVDEKANPLAERVWQQFKQGAMRAVSVGFLPHTIRQELRDDQEIFVLSDNELFEISATPIPANPEAVAKSAERNRDQLKRMVEQRGAIVVTPTTNLRPPYARAKSPAQSGQENAMDPKELQAKLDRIEAEKQELEKALKSEKDKNSNLSAELEQRGAALTKATEQRDAFEAQVIALEVKALVGTVISPAEAPRFEKLRKSDKELFDEMVADRKAMGKGALGNLLVQVTPADAVENKATGTNDGGASLVEMAEKEAAQG